LVSVTETGRTSISAAWTAVAATSSAASSQTVSLGGAQSSALSSGCVVRCERGCSYPGHCRRYTDSNQNGRCDLGECV
jgi:hypothetical protein